MGKYSLGCNMFTSELHWNILQDASLFSHWWKVPAYWIQLIKHYFQFLFLPGCLDSSRHSGSFVALVTLKQTSRHRDKDLFPKKVVGWSENEWVFSRTMQQLIEQRNSKPRKFLLSSSCHMGFLFFRTCLERQKSPNCLNNLQAG